MKKAELSIKIFTALVLGIILGLLFQGHDAILSWFVLLGKIYTSLIKMVMVPLVFTSLTMGIANLDDTKKMGKMGRIVVAVFLSTTAIAVILGLVVSYFIKPGEGIQMTAEAVEIKAYPNVMDTITGIVPDNIITALSGTNMLQVILISVVLGLGIVKAGKSGKEIYQLFESAYNVVIVITKGIMELTPIGVLGLMVPTVAQNGLEILLPLAKLIFAFYLAALIHYCLVYCVLIKKFTSYGIKEFEVAMLPAQMVAFSTCSSAAALPVSLQRLQEKLKISKEVSGFVLPLGATINMDGNALYQGIVALFVVQAYGIDMTFTMQLMVVLAGTFASIGAAGVPGAGVIVLSTVLASAGLPMEGVALVLGIDRILDMGRTFINVTGDAITAAIVQKYIHK